MWETTKEGQDGFNGAPKGFRTFTGNMNYDLGAAARAAMNPGSTASPAPTSPYVDRPSSSYTSYSGGSGLIKGVLLVAAVVIAAILWAPAEKQKAQLQKPSQPPAIEYYEVLKPTHYYEATSRGGVQEIGSVAPGERIGANTNLVYNIMYTPFTFLDKGNPYGRQYYVLRADLVPHYTTEPRHKIVANDDLYFRPLPSVPATGSPTVLGPFYRVVEPTVLYNFTDMMAPIGEIFPQQNREL
jgi:hypothetical protein